MNNANSCLYQRGMKIQNASNTLKVEKTGSFDKELISREAQKSSKEDYIIEGAKTAYSPSSAETTVTAKSSRRKCTTMF
ncbi:protein HUA2-LIKE 3-like [Sesbania bispinosa]|nr:protein HUA2-LIKE 3-like [Sesbania bispinosa]